MASSPPPRPRLIQQELVVRLAEVRDIPAICDFFSANREPLAAFEPRRPDSFYCQEFWQMRVQLNQTQFDDRRACCMFLFDTYERRVIGDINFTQIIGYPLYAATLGYGLDHRLWGGGRMRRALEMAIPYMWQHFNLHRISANHLPENARSARLLNRLGFQPEGYARDYLLVDGVWRDHVLNALTNKDWTVRDHAAPLLQTPSGQSAPHEPNGGIS